MAIQFESNPLQNQNSMHVLLLQEQAMKQYGGVPVSFDGYYLI